MKNFLIKHKIPFLLYQTNESLLLESKLGRYTNLESKFPAKEIWFIGAVKKYIVDNELYKKVKNNFRRKDSKSKIKYFSYNRKYKPGDVFEDCYEVDMKQAYFETAYKMKPALIPDHLYKRATNPDAPDKPISKRVRLAAIGSLARTRRRVRFDGTKQIQLKPERQKKTEFLWDTICYRVGKIMSKMAKQAGDDFIFFWVDALFVKESALKRVTEMMKKAGYNYSVTKVKKITFREKDILVDGKVKRVKDRATKRWVNKNERPFPYAGALTEKEITELANQNN